MDRPPCLYRSRRRTDRPGETSPRLNPRRLWSPAGTLADYPSARGCAVAARWDLEHQQRESERRQRSHGEGPSVRVLVEQRRGHRDRQRLGVGEV